MSPHQSVSDFTWRRQSVQIEVVRLDFTQSAQEDEVVMFDVRAVSRFFASPKAGRKCLCRNVLWARACFSVPSVQVIWSLHVRLCYYFHITCLMQQAWVFHLFKLMDIDSLPTLFSENQQLGSGVRGTVNRKVESWFEYVHVHISASCTLLYDSSCWCWLPLACVESSHENGS